MTEEELGAIALAGLRALYFGQGLDGDPDESGSAADQCEELYRVLASIDLQVQ